MMLMAVQQPVYAGLVSTPQLIPQNQLDLMQTRLDIQNQLVELGVEQLQAMNRVTSLSDDQIIEISSRISELPAGADLGGTLFTVFIIFVITDVIGATDIFPFIKPVR